MELCRSDLATVGPVSGLNTLKILPFGSKSRRQRIIVGDGAGFITCLQSKRGETSAVFKARAGENSNPVASLTLDGDNIFAAEGRAVRGFNKKGKETYVYNTSLSESIRHLVNSGSTFWVAGQLTYTSFEGSSEREYLKFEDSITSLAVMNASTSEKSIALLGGSGHKIRSVFHGAIVSTLATSGVPTSLQAYGENCEQGLYVYGTASGCLGMLQVCESGQLKRLWELAGEGSINCISTYDFNKDDIPNILVGRDDGSVQVFAVHGTDGASKTQESKQNALFIPECASLKYECQVDESVRAIQAGVVSTPGYDEIVLCTYSGNVISFSTEALDTAETGDKQGRTKADVDAEGRTTQLREELKSVQKQIDATRAKLLKLNGDTQSSLAINFDQLHINHRLELQPRRSTYCLSLEMVVPMSLVILQSDLPIKLIDTDEANIDGSRSSQSIVITKKELPTGGVHAVYRPEEACKRIEIRIGTLEGQYGEIRVTVVAATKPQLGRQLTVEIKPLSLHQRCDVIEDLAKIPLSHVRFTGTFSLHQVHEWIQACLPYVPTSTPTPETMKTFSKSRGMDGREEPGQEQPMAVLYYRNTLVNSVLVVRYCSGFIEVESDSISAIAIAREVITAVANKRKANIVMRFEINPATVPYFLQRLDAPLQKYTKLHERTLLADALREICNDADGSANGAFLVPEHRSILAKPETSSVQQNQFTSTLQALQGVVSDLYVDIKKFAGSDIRNPNFHAGLSRILDNYSLDALLNFFSQN